MTRYYKQAIEGGYAYIERYDDIQAPNAEEITQEEYDAALAELAAQRENEQDPVGDDYVSRLESENAALRKQLATIGAVATKA